MKCEEQKKNRGARVTDQVDMAWHLKKEVSVGHIVSTIILAGMLVMGYMDVQNRLALLETHPHQPAHKESERRLDLLEIRMTRVDEVNAAMAVRLEDLHQEILRRLDRQDIKLDRIENRLNEHDKTTP